MQHISMDDSCSSDDQIIKSAISEADLNIDFDYLENGLIIRPDNKDDQVSNPIFISSGGSAYKYIKTKLISEESNNLYILCLSNDFEKTDRNLSRINLFYEPDTTIDELYGQAGLVSLVAVPFFLVNIPSIRSGLIKIDNIHLRKFDPDLSNTNSKQSFVYLMLEVTETDVSKWLKQHTKNNLNKFIKKKIFTSYYGLPDESNISYISDMNDFHYWENPFNCKLNNNKIFDTHNINLDRQKWKLSLDKINDIITELEKISLSEKNNSVSECVPENKKCPIKPKKKVPTRGINQGEIRIDSNNSNGFYPTELTEPLPFPFIPKSATTYSNSFLSTKSVKSSYFGMNKPESDFEFDLVKELLVGNSLTAKEKYYLLTNLLVSKNYSRYVLRDDILSQYTKMFDQFKPVFRYVMSYACICLYKGEMITGSRTTITDSHVFDIETASKLPVFPFSIEDPMMNPYFTLLISKSNLNIDKNLSSIKSSFSYQTGIVGLQEFRHRLNIFMSGKSDLDILDGINWNSMVITGGCMAGIMPMKNPLMNYFGTGNGTDSQLNDFFSEYYGTSDIDVACNHTNLVDFMNHVVHMRDILCKNLLIDKSDLIVLPIKAIIIYVDSFIFKHKCENGEVPFTYDYFLKNSNSLIIKQYFFEIYIEQKIRANRNNIKILGEKINDPIFCAFMEYIKIDDMTLVFKEISSTSVHLPHLSDINLMN